VQQDYVLVLMLVEVPSGTDAALMQATQQERLPWVWQQLQH
jgi:hypothetical protein